MTESAWCTLHLTARPGVPVVGGLVAESADLLGLGPSERTRLRTMVGEVVESIVADSFDGLDQIDLDVSVERRAGGLTIVIEDRGAPSKLAQGTYPPRIADLIRLGFADDLSVRNLGRAGNRTEIGKDLTFPSVAADASFGAAAEAAEVEEIAFDADGDPILEVRPMTPEDVLEVARLFYRVYGYTAYQASIVYEPERLAEHVRAGHHVATVVVLPSGRVIGHLASEVENLEDRASRIGLLAVDPAYRGQHIADYLGSAHNFRLISMGFVGQYSEAVTVHNRSQKIALKSGAHEVGLMLAGQQPTLEFKGFDGETAFRRAVVLYYGQVEANPHRTVHVPAVYTEVMRRIYTEGQLDRELAATNPRPPTDVPETSRFNVTLKHEAGVAHIKVEQYGADFDSALQKQLSALRLNRYDLILVFLSLADPHTGFFGNGLQELGLSFSGVYPEFENGDVLVLQSLNNVDFDPEAILVASPLGEYLRGFVLDDYRRAIEGSARQMRSRAQLARVFEALE